MKHLNLWKSTLLLFALVAGSTSLWADNVTGTINFGSATGSTKIQGNASSGTGTVTYTDTGDDNLGNTWTITTVTSNDKSFTQSASYSQVGSSKKPATSITFTTTLPSSQTIKAFSAKFGGFSGTAGTVTLKVGNTNVGTGSLNGDNDVTVSATNTTTSGTVLTVTVTEISKGVKAYYISYTYDDGKAPSVSTPSITPGTNTYTSAQDVEITCETDGAKIYYTMTEDGTTPDDPTESDDEYTGTISVTKNGTKIKAKAFKDGMTASSVATATYTIYPVLHAGTAVDPYTVADARNAIDANTGLTNVYVSGIVCEGGSELADGAMNYWISDDGTETNKFEIYKGKGISGADFTATSDVKVGDEVVVYGTIKKYSSTYEFQSGSQLVSIKTPTIPLISVTPSSLTGFTYVVGSGPSAAQTFSVEGSNLTADITLSLGESNYEMSLAENSGYTNSLSLTQTAGDVAATTIYVHLKAGLDVNASYNGEIALTSTGATNKAVSLAGSVTQPNFTWDLSIDQTATASETELTWTGTFATMGIQKGTSTINANNYYPGTSGKSYTSTRFYTNEILTITPTSGHTISSIVFTATTEGYATALQESTWSNATAAADGSTVTVTPTDGVLPVSATVGGTCGFTAVKVYYEAVPTITLTPAKPYTTLTSSHNLDFTSVSSDLKAYIATKVSGDAVQMTQVNKVPAGTGLVLKATTPGSAVKVPVFDGTSPDDVSSNKMTGSATETTAIDANAGYILSDGVFQPAKAGTLAAGKAYLAIAVSSSAHPLEMNFEEGDVTSISEIEKMRDGENETFFNLAGQRVAQPTKGLYIVNGKKVFVP